jgi:hypothetical protein
VLLAKGKVVAEGRPRELVEGGSELLQDFLTSSGIAAERLLAERHSTV